MSKCAPTGEIAIYPHRAVVPLCFGSGMKLLDWGAGRVLQGTAGCRTHHLVLFAPSQKAVPALLNDAPASTQSFKSLLSIARSRCDGRGAGSHCTSRLLD